MPAGSGLYAGPDLMIICTGRRGPRSRRLDAGRALAAEAQVRWADTESHLTPHTANAIIVCWLVAGVAAALGIIYCANTISLREEEARRALWCSTAAIAPGLAVGLDYLLRLAMGIPLENTPLLRGTLLALFLWFIVGPVLFFFAWFDAPLRQTPALTAVRVVHGVHWLLSSLTALIIGMYFT